MPVPILSLSQMRQWEEASWASGRSQSQVIEQVGDLVAKRAQSLLKARESILILAGNGHNGDDARAAQPHLNDYEVSLLNVLDPKEDLAKLNRFLAAAPRLIIDGLFGSGINRPLDPAWIRFIEQVNAAQIPVLSIDLPSGLNAETGQPEGAAIRATVTLSVGAPKQGLLQPGGWPYVGRLEVAPEIGLIPSPVKSSWQFTLPEDFQGYPPVRPVHAHKGSFGHLVIFAGSLGYHGAAVLASRGALRARPGLVTLITPENVYLPIAAQSQAVMVHPWHPRIHLPGSCTAVLIGPGLASSDLDPGFKEQAVSLWGESLLPVVVDASGLDWLPEGAVHSSAPRAITPHPGEAARLLKWTIDQVQSDRPAAVRELSRRWSNCWIVLKGHQTLIGRSQGELFVNCSGNPDLAQGGSGDILAGFLGGLLAQKTLQADSLMALRYAVWQHGAAADRLSAEHASWTLENLIKVLSLGISLCYGL